MPRVYGIETEFGLTCTVAGGPRVGADEAARHLFRPVTEANAASSVFLRNGARLYLDVGSHPEYATPECATLLDLITHDRAGELILTRLATQAERLLAEEGTIARMRLFKNNLDMYGNSYGSHENYLVGRWEEYGPQAELMAPFLVSRQLICGTGAILVDKRGVGRFVLSQRAEHMWEALSSTTTRARPMINTRDEPHADPRRFRRLHVIVGDSTMSDPTTLLRVGSTEAVLRLVEADDDRGRRALADLAVEDATAAIRTISRDVTGRAHVRLVDGRTISGLDLQRAVLVAVAPYLDGLDEVASRWRRTLDAIESTRLSQIDDSIDWAIKWRLLDEVAQRERCDLADPRLRALDLAYHDIGPAGLLRRLERSGAVARLVPDDAVERAVETPPGSTRAALRGRLVRAAQVHQRDYTADWASFSVNDLPDATLLSPDPLLTEDPRVNLLIERMRAEPRQAGSLRFSGLPPA